MVTASCKGNWGMQFSAEYNIWVIPGHRYDKTREGWILREQQEASATSGYMLPSLYLSVSVLTFWCVSYKQCVARLCFRPPNQYSLFILIAIASVFEFLCNVYFVLLPSSLFYFFSRFLLLDWLKSLLPFPTGLEALESPSHFYRLSLILFLTITHDQSLKLTFLFLRNNPGSSCDYRLLDLHVVIM